MTAPEPTQPLTETELQAILGRTTRVMDDEYIDTDGAYYSAMDVPKLLAERNKLLDDLQWYITDLGPEHWQNCDGDDCYLCDGHVAIRDHWKASRPVALDQSGESTE